MAEMKHGVIPLTRDPKLMAADGFFTGET